MKKSFFICFLFFFIFPFFAQVNILSPKSGIWANKQMLIIEDKNKSEIFYSIDGSDPQNFGFVYDGPILLDVEGNVNLQILILSKDGKKTTQNINYSVNPQKPISKEELNFVSLFYDFGLINYTSGSKIQIPFDFQFSFDNFDSINDVSFIDGREICLSSSNVFLRYIPIIIKDKKNNIFWRFIIKTLPQNVGIYGKREVPFLIENWEKIIFTSDDLLYKIDDEFWSLPTESRILDRNESHMISWQNLEYDSSNIVNFFVLPAKPKIQKKHNSDGSIDFLINGDDSYSMTILDNSINESYNELFSKIGIDTFYGDCINGKMNIGIYSNSVFQGTIEVDYNIDKKPPKTPTVKSSAKSFYSKNPVTVEIECPKNAELFISLSEPLLLKNSQNILTEESELLKEVKFDDFRKIQKNPFSIKWGQKNTNPVFYKIKTYCKIGDSVSQIKEYSVIIEESCLYFDENADETEAEGTLIHPFTNFNQVYEELSSSRNSILKIKGEMKIDKKYLIDSNIEIQNRGDAKIIFENEGNITLRNSSLDIKNCRIHNESQKSQKFIKHLFNLENAVLTLNNCVIGVDFNKNGTVIESLSSVVNIYKTISSVNSIDYSSFISSVNSRLNIRQSSFSTSSETNVIFSVNGGNVIFDNNVFTISGNTGRIGEFFEVKGNIINNKFYINLLQKNDDIQNNPLFINEKSNINQNQNIIAN